MDWGALIDRLDDRLGAQGGELPQLLDLLVDNADALKHLAKLPDFLESFAGALAGAGEQARAAAAQLVGDDGKEGIQGVLADASKALGAILDSVEKGAERVLDAAEATAKVPLMDKPAARLSGAAEELRGTTSQLSSLAEAMEEIAGTLGRVGSALAKLGDHLDDSGSSARGFAQL
ncbi:MAG: hypothetical protein ACI379_16100 [Nocardioides sp.]|uniref:hypothetical protein n=1 Tax=Nocardioides sp. TaxID=35761 RepID=UPI003EFBEC9D